MRVLIKTFGCKVNYADSEELATSLAERGHQCSYDTGDLDSIKGPDVVVVNTCAVTANATKKGRQFVRRCMRKLPEVRLIITGCGVREENIASQFTVLDATVVGDLETIVNELSRSDFPVSAPRERRTRRFIKIQDGCSSFCSYCIIPYVRSLSSKPTLEVMNEIQEAKEEEAPEIVICGINLGLYSDPENGIGLVQLLRQALDETPEWSRLRLSSIEPEYVTNELLDLFSHPRLCPHLHLPLQSGSDSVLAAMNRKYDSNTYRRIVAGFRDMYPQASLTTDVMVGFPGEADGDFAATREVICDCEFERIHVFRYSERPRTAAGKMKMLPGQVVYKRKNQLVKLCQEVSAKSLSRFIGTISNVAAEEDGCGYGEAYQRVRMDTIQLKGVLVPVKLAKLESGVFAGSPSGGSLKKAARNCV